MKFINKQAFNGKVASDNQAIYTPTVDAQIRAFTIHNPTPDNVTCGVTIGANTFINTTIPTNTTEALSPLFNQQIAKGESVKITGTGLNVLLTTVEIVE